MLRIPLEIDRWHGRQMFCDWGWEILGNGGKEDRGLRCGDAPAWRTFGALVDEVTGTSPRGVFLV